ncbi:bifunctional DNA-formamidopyrimidine glycosylase/DNA-(apurinic or apyrimidinic site) lyase [Defluviicoccus vanus]|uniref:Formamidopyrimidine-DNA glycosylase n=1 Tax=Defluviicoccus vanus TaxID=111831 RepID=A0A7H1N1J6_9PROT|nr:bifunctional DNA-formamidopyrimidine glycosylase/DNA-(apurinic or apyrimidinic site) lyase [Defluviicoccus vanus]QNT69582.1 bifunctional DNA-formamidopyrimidine glycosylase/DNA-(apurinic or apyrimidinic site) lyase [Defluviicoccus vanus]
MPELPEVETVRRGLVPAFVGHCLTGVVQRRPDLRFPLPDDFAGRLRGRRIDAIDRRGKYLLLLLENSWVWIAHLGMSGRFRIFPDAPDGEEAHDHLLFTTDAGATVTFNDPRRFGFMDLVMASEVDRHPMLMRLGPDPLGPLFDAAYLAARLQSRRTPIKAALLDQGIVAGMGNIYASESLFRARIAPDRLAASLTPQQVETLVASIRSVFVEAIAAGGSSLRDHRQPSGELGFFQHHFAVYGRAGRQCPDCRCNVAETGGIRRIVQSGRATFFCGRHQR